MLSSIPYRYNSDQKTPAAEGEPVAFWRVWEHTNAAFDAKAPGDWRGDFPSAEAAAGFIGFFHLLDQRQQPGSMPEPRTVTLTDETPAIPVGVKVTPYQAAEALDSLDDYARMATGVDAIGPRGLLQRFIGEVAADRDGVPAVSAAYPKAVDADIDEFLKKLCLQSQERAHAQLIFPAGWRKMSEPVWLDPLEFVYGLKALRLSQTDREVIMRAFHRNGVFAARLLAAQQLASTKFAPLAAEDSATRWGGFKPK